MASRLTTSDGAVSSDASASVAASAGLGVIAAAVGYLVTYLLIASEVRAVFGDDVSVWKGAAWYYYSAHLVDIEVAGSIGSIGGTDTVDLIAESGATSADLLYLLPPVVLLGTGAFLAYRLNARGLGEAVTVGAPVAIGYAVVATLGALVAEASTENSVFGIEISGSVAPQFVPAVVLAGILYPLVFATAGAVLAASFVDR